MLVTIDGFASALEDTWRKVWPPIASFAKSEVAQFWLEGLNWKAVFLASKEAEEKGKAYGFLFLDMKELKVLELWCLRVV